MSLEPAANVVMKGEPAMPLPWPASRLPEVSASPRFRSGLARALMVIRAEAPEGQRSSRDHRHAGRGRVVLGRGDPDRSVVRSPEHAVAARDDGIVPVIPQVAARLGSSGLLNEKTTAVIPAGPSDELLPGHHGRDRVHRAAVTG